MPRVVREDSSDDESAQEDLEIARENAQRYDERLEGGFDKARVQEMQRVMEPFEQAVRNSLSRVDYTKDEGLQTRNLLHRWLATLSNLRSGVENQTRWPGSGFGKLLKTAHSMRITRLKEKHKKKGWLRHDACKCQVCGTKEHECNYVIEICGSCEDEEEAYHADDWLRVDVRNLNKVWESFYNGYTRLFDNKLLSDVRSSKSMPKQYLGMFATGETCLKRAMAAFNLQVLPMEICYRADMVAAEATLELQKRKKNKHAMLNPDDLVNCDPEDAIQVLTKVQALERAVTAIDQGKAHLVNLQIEQMPDLWNRIDEAKRMVVESMPRPDDLDDLDNHADDHLERMEYQMCGRIADEALARIKGVDLEDESDASSGQHQAADRGARASKQGQKRTNSAEWGQGFAQKKHRKKPRKPPPRAVRGRGGRGGKKQTDIRTSMRSGSAKDGLSDGSDSEFVPSDDSAEDEDASESEDAEEELVRRRPRSKRASGHRRHGSLVESSGEEEEEEEVSEEVVSASLQSLDTDEMRREQRRRCSRFQKQPAEPSAAQSEEDEEENEEDAAMEEALRESQQMAEEREVGGPSGTTEDDNTHVQNTDPAARATGMRIPGPNGEAGSLPSRKRVIEQCYEQASLQARNDPALSMLLAHAAMTIQELDSVNKRLRCESDGTGRA